MATQTKILRGTPKWLALRSPLGKVPFDVLMMNLRFSCPYKCSFCCNEGMQTSENALTLEEMKTLLGEASKAGCRALVLAGEGEPFACQETIPLIRHAALQNLATIVFTNASYLTTEKAKAALESGATLVFSIASLDRQRYELLVGRPNSGVFDAAIRNIAAARKMAAQLPAETTDGAKVVRLAANHVVTLADENLARKEVEKIKAFCQPDMMFVANYVSERGSAELNHLVGNGYTIQQRLALELSENIGPTGIISENGKDWCGYYRYGLSVGADGNILPCAYALDAAGRFGKVKDADGRITAAHLIRLKKRIDSETARVERDGHCYCTVRNSEYKKLWLQ